MGNYYCVPIEALIYIKIIAGSVLALVALWLGDTWFNWRQNTALSAYHRREIDLLGLQIEKLKQELELLKKMKKWYE
jgi:hypothetical protein